MESRMDEEFGEFCLGCISVFCRLCEYLRLGHDNLSGNLIRLQSTKILKIMEREYIGRLIDTPIALIELLYLIVAEKCYIDDTSLCYIYVLRDGPKDRIYDFGTQDK